MHTLDQLRAVYQQQTPFELDPAAKAEFVKNGATTFFHQVGTARMGNDPAITTPR